MKIATILLTLSFSAVALDALAQAQPSPTVPQTEQSDVATLAPSNPHRIFTIDSFGQQGIKILDGDTLDIKGVIQSNGTSVLAIDPQERFFYVSESIWTKGNRGARQDMVSVYDSRTLNLLSEIDLPGRLIIDARTHIFDVSSSGKYGYVYNLQPASSVIVVDLERRKVQSTVELPGCALAFPWMDGGFSALCGDGSLANVVLGGNKPKVTHSVKFFDADNDPIFEESLVDRATGKAIFLSYSGQIFEAQLGTIPSIGIPWSLQTSAGMQPASTGVQELAWRPGGLKIIAWHKQMARLYVLMHPGTHWTHKEAGTELWVIDLAGRSMMKRLKLPAPAVSVVVSQDTTPLIYILTEERHVMTIDADTGEKKSETKGASGRFAWVSGF